MKTVIGLDELVANFNREVIKIKGLSEVGLIKMAIMIERSWNYDAPVIPVDTNNLRQSWFAITQVKSHSAPHNFKGKNAANVQASTNETLAYAKTIVDGALGKPTLVMGFGANYAAEVESTDKHYRRPNSGSHFFQGALNRNRDKIMTTLKETINL